MHVRRRVVLAGLPLIAAGLLAGAAWPCGPARAGESAQRIVALGGAVTEILYALGLEDHIVGVDTTSLYPQRALAEKPNVGYLRALSAEGILSLKPSIVIAVDGAGPPDVMKLVAEAGVPVSRLPEDPTPAGVLARIEAVGALVGAAEKAQELARATRAGFAALEAMRARIGKPAKAMFLLSLSNGRPVVGGRKTTADAMIAMAGGTNVAEAIEGFKPMTDEAVIAAAPEAILMMSNAGSVVTAEQVFALPVFAATPAARNHAFISMDGNFLLGFGPRTPQAARELMGALHPGAALPDLPKASQ